MLNRSSLQVSPSRDSGTNVPTEAIPEEYTERIEMIAGYPVAVSSYRLGGTYYAKAAIALFGTGGRIATAEDTTKAAAEEKVRAEVEKLLRL